MGRGSFDLPTASQVSRTFLKTALKKKAVIRWRAEVAEKCRRRRAFHTPKDDRAPGIPEGLRRAPKEVASRFSQLASGHAMIAPFLKDKFKWLESDMCWWCGGGKQSREHLFKECRTWKGEIRTLWKKVGEIAGNQKAKNLQDVYKGERVSALVPEEKMYDQAICRLGGCCQIRGLLRRC